MAKRVQVREEDGYWARMTDEDDLHGVEVDGASVPGGFSVTVSVMEFVRGGPLEAELRRRIAAALQSAGGVVAVAESDREVWWVEGSPSGESLVRAVAEVLNDFDGQLRAAYDEV